VDRSGMTWSSRDPALRSGSSGCGRCTSGGRTVGRLTIISRRVHGAGAGPVASACSAWSACGGRSARQNSAIAAPRQALLIGTAAGGDCPVGLGVAGLVGGKGAPTPFRPDLPDRLGKGAPTPLRPGNPCAGHDAIPWFEARGWPEDGGRDARTGTRRSDSLTEPRNNVQACRWRSAVAKAARGNAYASLTLIH
jgi:hypothetical protein